MRLSDARRAKLVAFVEQDRDVLRIHLFHEVAKKATKSVKRIDWISLAIDHVVRHVLIHEIGHHFGFSDDDMTGIEKNA